MARLIARLLARLGFQRVKRCGCGNVAAYDGPTGEALCGFCAAALAEAILKRAGRRRRELNRQAAHAHGRAKRRSKRKATGR